MYAYIHAQFRVWRAAGGVTHIVVVVILRRGWRRRTRFQATPHFSPLPNILVFILTSPHRRWILTHDFTHRTHAIIFGYQYPRSLPDWSSDDWITYVYEQFGLMSKRDDIPVLHTLSSTRYVPSEKFGRLHALNGELKSGAEMLVEWAKATHGVDLSYKLIVRDCC